MMPIDRITERLQAIAGALDKTFNGERKPGEVKTIGFALLVFPFSGKPGNRVNYISNAQRAPMIRAIEEWICRQRPSECEIVKLLRDASDILRTYQDSSLTAEADRACYMADKIDRFILRNTPVANSRTE